jgi:hypothetical protein
LKKHIGKVVLIVLFLVVFIPFASSNPDGLEKVIENFEPRQHTQFWNGIMPEYTVATITNQYLSTFLAGLFGIFIVLLASFVIGKAIAPKTRRISE